MRSLLRIYQIKRTHLANPALMSVVAIMMLFSDRAAAEWGLNLPEPSTPIAREIIGLHNGIMIACLIIFIVVFAAMFYSFFAHRQSKGYEPAQFSHSTKMEILWTVIPTLILIGFAIPSTATLLKMEDTTNAGLTIKITGYQWKWHYDYLDTPGVGFYSNLSTPAAQIRGDEPKGEHYLLEVDKPLVIPVDTKVRFLMTASDVIHSWWVPSFGVKKDAIPGFINESWATVETIGTYRGQCTELCGKDHGYMPVVVEVVSAEDFETWLAEQETALSKADNTEQLVKAETGTTAKTQTN